MALVVRKRTYPRGEPDNTAVFAASAASTFTTIAQKWGAIDTWTSPTTRRSRLLLDSRLVPPPDDTAWIRAASNAANAIAQQWPSIEGWRSETTRPKRLIPDTRRVPPPDDTAWIRGAATTFIQTGQRWPAIDTWTQEGNFTPKRPTSPPRLSFDDLGWIAVPAPSSFAVAHFAAIDAWIRAIRTGKTVAWPNPGDAWSFGSQAPDFAQLWPAIEAWKAETIRRRAILDPRRVAPPDDTAGQGGTVLNISPATPPAVGQVITFTTEDGGVPPPPAPGTILWFPLLLRRR